MVQGIIFVLCAFGVLPPCLYEAVGVTGVTATAPDCGAISTAPPATQYLYNFGQFLFFKLLFATVSSFVKVRKQQYFIGWAIVMSKWIHMQYVRHLNVAAYCIKGPGYKFNLKNIMTLEGNSSEIENTSAVQVSLACTVQLVNTQTQGGMLGRQGQRTEAGNLENAAFPLLTGHPKFSTYDVCLTCTRSWL